MYQDKGPRGQGLGNNGFSNPWPLFSDWLLYVISIFTLLHKIMTRLAFQNDTFTCHLACDRCSYTKTSGEQCKNRVCFGIPLCWQHTVKQYGLRLKPSTIPNAGKGVFTTTARNKGDWLCPYVGQVITNRCVTRRYGEGTAPYTITHRRLNVDSACKRGIGSMVNGLFNNEGRSLEDVAHNVSLEYRAGGRGERGLWLYATKNIPANSELFAHYGDQYRLENNHSTRRTRHRDNRPC